MLKNINNKCDVEDVCVDNCEIDVINDTQNISRDEHQQNAKWYILHTYSGYEYNVKANLETLVKNSELKDRIFSILIPTSKTIVETSKHKKKEVEKKDFPGYVFVKMDYSNEYWHLITSVRGVAGFVGPLGKPTPLKDSEVQAIGIEQGEITRIDIVEGDNVMIIYGPLESFVGKVVNIDNKLKKITVNIFMFGRNIDAKVDFLQVKKIV